MEEFLFGASSDKPGSKIVEGFERSDLLGFVVSVGLVVGICWLPG